MDRALVVDDEKNIRLLLAETLATIPLEADCAASAEEALTMLPNKRYSILLLDLRLPGMDGIEALHRIRDLRPDIPVILLTAYGSVGVAVEAMRLGATDFIQKPFDPDELRNVIRRVLDRQRIDANKATDYASHFELAKRCIGQSQLDAAIEHLHLAIGIAPDRPEAFNMLGAILELRRDIAEALKQYRIALEIDPTYEAARRNLDRAVTSPLRAGQIHLGELRQRR